MHPNDDRFGLTGQDTPGRPAASRRLPVGLALLGLGLGGGVLGGGVLGGGVLLRLAPGESALAAVPLLGNGLTRLSVVAEMAAQLATEAAV